MVKRNKILVEFYLTTVHIFMKKVEKGKRTYFYWQVFLNFLFGKVVGKEFSCKFKLRGLK